MLPGFWLSKPTAHAFARKDLPPSARPLKITWGWRRIAIDLVVLLIKAAL
jgi:hypothetical protein